MAGLDKNTSLLVHFDGADTATNTTDESENNHTDTFANQAELDTAQKKFGTASLLLDGTTDYVSFPDHAQWDIVGTTGAVTVDMHVKHDDHAGTERYLAQYEGVNDFWFFYHTDGTGLGFLSQDGGSTDIDFSGGTEITDTDWHHVALIRVLDDWQIYLDGAAVCNAQNENHTHDHTGLLGIGGLADGDNFDGHIDEVRIQASNPFGADPTNGSDTITVPTKAYSAIDTRSGIAIGHGPHIYYRKPKAFLWVPHWYQRSTIKGTE